MFYHMENIGQRSLFSFLLRIAGFVLLTIRVCWLGLHAAVSAVYFLYCRKLLSDNPTAAMAAAVLFG
eukprot:SAG31_NODE_31949_length_362_cov_0.642586_1_plen_66_part_10